MNASSPYNIIIGRLMFNALDASMSTLYLTMKYPIEGGQVGVIKYDQELARKCYKDSLKLKKKTQHDLPMIENTLKVNLVDLNPQMDLKDDSLTPIGELRKGANRC